MYQIQEEKYLTQQILQNTKNGKKILNSVFCYINHISSHSVKTSKENHKCPELIPRILFLIHELF